MRHMKRIKFVIGILAILGLALAIFFVLRSDNALLTHPKGIIARSELDLIITNYLLMLIVVVPTLILLFVIAWKYRAKNTKAKYDPEHSHGAFGELILWIIPSVVIAVMAVITWNATHKLDPYKPLESDVKPLNDPGGGARLEMVIYLSRARDCNSEFCPISSTVLRFTLPLRQMALR